jgi:DHA1 family tetracycline resistance protein-like MFS transporter
MFNFMRSQKLNLACIVLIYALDSFGIAIAYPVFAPIFFGEHTPFLAAHTPLFHRALLFGILIALFPIAQFISVPFIGDFSDRVGRRKTFIFTLLGSTFSYLLAALGIYFHSVLLLCISRLSSGLFAGNTSLCFASLADISTSDQERGKNFGLLGAFGGLGFFVSILCGEYFFNKAHPSHLETVLPFLIVALLSLLAFISMLLLFHESKPSARGAKFHFMQGYHHIVSTLHNESLKNAYMIYFFFAIGWVAIMQFYSPILIEVYKKPPISFTVNLVAIGALWSLANFFAQRFLIKRFSPKEILWFTVPLLFLFLLSCIPSQGYISFSIHFSIAVFMAALTWTNTFANVSLHAPKEIQGRIMGINQSFSSIATIIASLGGGFFAGIYPSFALVFSTLCVAAAFFFLKTKKVSI